MILCAAIILHPISHCRLMLFFCWLYTVLLMVTFLELTALCGNYVNFGVFELYGDRALADVLDISLKMTLSIPLSDILAFRKVLMSTLSAIHVLGHCF
jgi:hypothetical protein